MFDRITTDMLPALATTPTDTFNHLQQHTYLKNIQ